MQAYVEKKLLELTYLMQLLKKISEFNPFKNKFPCFKIWGIMENSQNLIDSRKTRKPSDHLEIGKLKKKTERMSNIFKS